MNLDSTAIGTSDTTSISLLQLKLRRLSQSSETNKPSCRQEEQISTYEHLEFTLNNYNNKQDPDHDFIFSEDPLNSEEGLSPDGCPKTRASTLEIFVSPFATYSDNNKLENLTESLMFGDKSSKESDVSHTSQCIEQKHDYMIPGKAAKKLLYVNTTESSARKVRLVHSTTVPMVKPEFQQSVKQLEALKGMQERIFQFLDTEDVHMQHVGEYIREKNQGSFKGMSKLSSLKLDLSKSPLRRNRANTMCI